MNIDLMHADVILRADSISRSFMDKQSVSHQVLHSVSINVRKGEICCLLGPNGAGKTTFIKIASTLLCPDSGSLSICDIDAIKDPIGARKHVALLLGGDRGFYMRSSAIANLYFFAQIANVPLREMNNRITAALDKVNLLDKANSNVETYSRGMIQRLHIARAIIEQAPLLLLDEPTIGLDPEHAMQIRNIIDDLRNEGKGILLTTHSMSEAEALSDSVNILSKGCVIARGTISKIAEDINLDGVCIFTLPVNEWKRDESKKLLLGMKQIQGVSESLRGNLYFIDIAWKDEEPDEMTIGRVLNSPSLRFVGRRPPTLEEVYLSIMEKR